MASRSTILASSRGVRRACSSIYSYFRCLESLSSAAGVYNGRIYSSKFRCRSHSYSTEQQTVEGPIAAYHRLTKEGLLKHGDMAQERVAGALENLYQDVLRLKRPSALQEKILKMFWKWPLLSQHKDKIQGLYIYGGVGTGKTMLMDLFFNKIQFTRKRRVHFHSFMLDVHSRLHGLAHEQTNKSAEDFIEVVAMRILEEAQLLCLDEVEVTDIADALILKRIFEVLWPLGVILVATSNSTPDQLYRNGLNRHLFVPFITQLKENCSIYCLDNQQDYRRLQASLGELYMFPIVGEVEAAMDEGFLTLSGGHSAGPTQVPVMMGRQLQILAADGVARAPFSMLCAGNYGAADYMAIAKAFGVLFLDRVPWLGDPALENQARRFVTLIDVLYEANTIFICSAAVSPDLLFKETADEDQKDNVNREKVEGGSKNTNERDNEHLKILGQGGSSGRSTAMIGGMEWSGTGRPGASLAQLSGVSFTRAASLRTVSRLVEMQSQTYLARSGKFGKILLGKAKHDQRT